MPDVCDRCGFPVVERGNGRWVHASSADAVFCALVMSLGLGTEVAEDA